MKLNWVGTPKPIETRVTPADAPKVLVYSDTQWELEAFAGGTRLSCGTTSIVASSPVAPRAGTLLSMFWIGCSPVSPLDASSALMP